MLGIPGSGATLRKGTQEAGMPAPFEIVWQISPEAAPVVLRSVTDANAATIAFGEELRRLRGHAAPGELLVRRGEDTHPPRLRQPLKSTAENRAIGARGTAGWPEHDEKPVKAP
jgi:hypothetical protein